MSDDGEIRVHTIRELLNALTAKAAELPDGLDTQIAAGTCDGAHLTMAWTVDVDYWARLAHDDRQQFVLIRAHPHLDPEPLPPMPRGAHDIG